jgi:hypothetical protein
MSRVTWYGFSVDLTVDDRMLAGMEGPGGFGRYERCVVPGDRLVSVLDGAQPGGDAARPGSPEDTNLTVFRPDGQCLRNGAEKGVLQVRILRLAAHKFVSSKGANGRSGTDMACTAERGRGGQQAWHLARWS